MTVLKSGDLVVLKSGGPVMTVDTVNTDILDDNKVTGILCAWFVGDKLQRARFDPDALAPAGSPGGGLAKDETGSHDASGEYTTVLDEMVAAMNDAADASKTIAVAAKETAAEKSKRVSFAKTERDLSGPSTGMQAD